MTGRNRHSANGGQRGFILIGTVWLLLLCAAIVAVLMLRAHESIAGATGERDILESRLALDSAIDVVVADLIFNGNRSRWSRLPASGSITVSDRPIAVTLSSETGRADLNDGDPAVIAAALQGLGVEPRTRAGIVDEIRARRAKGERVASWAGLQKLLAPADGRCLEDHFTLYSGLSAPRENQASPELLRALGKPATAFGPSPPEPGSALRLAAQTEQGASLTVIIRVTAQREQPYVVMRWSRNQACK